MIRLLSACISSQIPLSKSTSNQSAISPPIISRMFDLLSSSLDNTAHFEFTPETKVNAFTCSVLCSCKPGEFSLIQQTITSTEVILSSEL